MGETKVLRQDSINQRLVELKFDISGVVPQEADLIVGRMASGEKFPFEQVLYCNIGNPQAVGQKPITFYRDVLTLVNAPHLLENKAVVDSLPIDVIQRAEEILSYVPCGTGAYSPTCGIRAIREEVAKFIEERDGYPSNPDHIFLTNGATSGIECLFTTIMSDTNVGVLIPKPQYPVYAALVKLLNGVQLDYNLNEEKDWEVDITSIKEQVKSAKNNGINPRALVLINPGNPTGNVLSYEVIENLVKFCKSENIMIIADEVYQANIYSELREFHSVKKVVRNLGREYDSFEFVSLHSTSKGYLGECGRRGGYMELCGVNDDVLFQITKFQSTRICPGVDGQVMTSLMVRPPKLGDASFEEYSKQKSEILQSLSRKSNLAYEALNSIDGVSCRKLDGAMYAFPKISLSVRAIEAANNCKMAPDVFYALSLLRATGIVAVPGSGFGQEVGTYHLRITFLPKEQCFEKAMQAFKKHHLEFSTKYDIDMESKETEKFEEFSANKLGYSSKPITPKHQIS